MQTLNERAAKCMGLGATKRVWAFSDEFYYERDNKTERFDPEHDRNAAHELLMEVGRRGLGDKFMEAFFQSPNVGYLGKSLDRQEAFEFAFWCMKAPLDLIVTAACEVLEEN